MTRPLGFVGTTSWLVPIARWGGSGLARRRGSGGVLGRRRRRGRIQNLLHEQLLVSLGAEGAFAGQQLEQNHPSPNSMPAACAAYNAAAS